MVNYFIYAKDYSASTNSMPYYHEHGLRTLEQFKSDVQKINNKLLDSGESQIIYLHWGHECVKVDEETAIEEYLNKCGDGNNTLPETIIQWINKHILGENKIKLLYIITDGLISSNSLNKCLILNENINYENVVFHGINKYVERIDLSVAATFLKGRCAIYRNNELLDDTDISQEFDYASITLDNFATRKNDLISYIRYKFINSSKKNEFVLKEIDKLKKLRNRLFMELSVENTVNLDTTDKNIFMHAFKNTGWYKNLRNPTNDMKIDIEKFVTTLINYIVSEKKSYAFDALKFASNFSHEVPEEQIVDVNFTTDQEIEFPDIILDDTKGIPVILCTELNLLDKIIFHTSVSTASFSKFKSIMECPLFLLNDPDLNESIGYFYTLTVYKELLKQSTKTEPRTRRPFHGGLVLVDTDEFDRYNDYILSATYFNFKKVKYNVGLFYFVLWKICEKKQWMDKNVVEQFKKYMLRRVSTTVCNIALSSLPLDPQVTASLPMALWYCVELSSYIFKHDPQHFAYERLRMYYGVAYSMIEILNYLDYDLDLEAIDKRTDLIRHVMILKKIPIWRDKVFYLLEKIFKTVDGFLVCEIENPSNVYKLNYLKLNHKEMLSDDIITGEINLNEYVYFMYHIDNSNSQTKICKNTFRPYFTIDQNKSFYSELYEIAKKIATDDVGGKILLKYDTIDELQFSRILSLYNLFLHCVKDSGKYPTLKEYTEYVLRKKKFKENLVIIFNVNVSEDIKSVFLQYEAVIKDVSVSEFVNVCNKYVSRIERIKVENIRNFENDIQIHEFISKEECKNKLMKVT